MCTTCGTTLTDVAVVKREAKPAAARRYDHRYGEADLLEGEGGSRGRMYLFSAALVVALLVCGGAVLFTASRMLGLDAVQPTPTITVVSRSADGTEQPILVMTNTPRPTMVLPTVTPAPPTATPTPTEGPCTRQVQAGDDLLSLAYSCGHRSLDVVPLVLEMNDLSAPEQLQAGQTLLIPWPTPTGEAPVPTVEGEAASTEGVDASMPDGGQASSSVAAAGELSSQNGNADSLSSSAPSTRTPLPTPTLLPGVAWHVVQPNQSMAEIAYTYNTNAETLSQLNPEISFSQCDYQYDSGGDSCTVLLQIGQQIRVPAPTPTATLSPTLSGSETPTPSATPTYNAPSALSPGNRARFGRDDMITLRWIASGLLSAGEAYRVTVQDLTTNTTFSADTSDLFYIVPGAWQGQDGRRHEYRWTVSVIRLDDPEHPTFTTEARLFYWDGRGE
jgi:LysM repeat protein